MRNAIKSILFASCLLFGSGSVLPSTTWASIFNLDFGSGPSPTVSYGAAAGQTGFWNVVTGSPLTLTDTAGTLTSVTLSFPALSSGTFNHAGTSGDDQSLLDDFMTWDPLGPMNFNLSGLQAGTYLFYTYSFAPNGANSWVDVAGSPEGFQLLGGSWSGSHQLGVTYALHTVTLSQPGSVNVTVGVWNAAWGGVNGMQVVLIPAPATLGLLLLGGLSMRRGRRAD